MLAGRAGKESGDKEKPRGPEQTPSKKSSVRCRGGLVGRAGGGISKALELGSLLDALHKLWYRCDAFVVILEVCLQTGGVG